MSNLPGAERIAAASNATERALAPFLLALLASAAAWGLLFFLFPPWTQNFPLIDDWAFARGAFRFAHGEGIHYFGWASMPLLGQWLWAVPWIRAIGADPVVLRIATIVLSWFGLWGFYDLLLQARTPATHAGLATAVLALNPLFFLLQGTFMTDVPALSFSLIALDQYSRAISKATPLLLAGATTAALLAVLTRQNALAVPLTAGLLLMQTPRLRWRLAWWLVILVPLIVGIGIHRWFLTRSDIRPLPVAIPSREAVLAIALAVAEMAGLAALPLLAADPRPGAPRALVIAAALIVPLAVYWVRYGGLLLYGGLFPSVDGVLTRYGVYTAVQYWGARPVVLGESIRWVLTVIGCAAGILLIARLVWRISPMQGSAAGLHPLLIFGLLQFPLLAAPERVYDRYFVVILPTALYLAAPLVPRLGWGWISGLVLLALFAAVSIGLMHDWLAWNSARWAVGRRAVARGISPHDIDGGLEWNGWFAPEIRGESQPEAGLTLSWTKGYFPHVTGRYALAFSQPADSAIVDMEPYTQWLVPGPHAFLLVRDRPEN